MLKVVSQIICPPVLFQGFILIWANQQLKLILRMKKMKLQKKPEMVFFGSVCFGKHNLLDNQIFEPQVSYYFRLSKKLTPPFFDLVIYNLYQASYQVRKQFAAGDIE